MSIECSTWLYIYVWNKKYKLHFIYLCMCLMYSLINKQECYTSFKIRDAADNPIDKDQGMMIDRSFSLGRATSRIFFDESLGY